MTEQWNGFAPGRWARAIDVDDFVRCNYTPYEGGEIAWQPGRVPFRPLPNAPAPARVEEGTFCPESLRHLVRAGQLDPPGAGRTVALGDARRVALYGIDRLAAPLRTACASDAPLDPRTLARRARLAERLEALEELRTLGLRAGVDLSLPAGSFQQAALWLALTCRGGPAPGRADLFLDIYAERDLAEGLCGEAEVQAVTRWLLEEGVLRTLTLGGIGADGRARVTRMSARLLRAGLMSAPAGDFAVLWSDRLPRAFRQAVSRAAASDGSLRLETQDTLAEGGGDSLLLCAGLPFSPGREELAFSPAVHLNEVVRAVRKGAAADAGWSALAGPLAGALETLAGAACDAWQLTAFQAARRGTDTLARALSDEVLCRRLVPQLAGLEEAAALLAGCPGAPEETELRRWLEDAFCAPLAGRAAALGVRLRSPIAADGN